MRSSSSRRCCQRCEFSRYWQSGTGETLSSDLTPTSMTASREVFSPTGMDDESENEGPDPDSLAARLTRQVEAMRAQES